MNIYHYSNALYKTLLTKRASGKATSYDEQFTDKELVPGISVSYIDHISFFLDPIPSVLLSKIFGKGHAAWFPGNKMYEYVVDVDSLDKDIIFSLVESRNKTKFLDDFTEENNWVEHDPELLKRYKAELAALQRQWGESGAGLKQLKKVIHMNAGGTTEAFTALPRRPDFEDNRMKYAACVPHLMLYPKGGKIEFTSAARLVIGNEHRTPILRLPSLNW